ncbi:uncharacterized protein LOC122094682 [Macadamia integrifolia]|uniref:uncharacterized protein LOC122094682 n=1 Tax=Macadamia integrifolia TaxID=60698 RepID=UPI001C5341D8|nr:uncharacterized protein LOC122094682 [Macadamia integrifolia]
MASSSQLNNENAKWTKSEVDLYVMLMIDEVKKGNRTRSTFKKAGWNNIMSKFEAKTGHRYNMVQFRNKINKLKQDYINFEKLLDTCGFTWNPLTRTVTADDDAVWDKHIKANPNWAKFRRFGLPQWPELQVIFGDTNGCGDNALVQVEDVPNTDEEDDHDVDHDSGFTTPFDGGLDDVDGGDPEENPQSKSYTHDNTPTGKRSRSGSTDFSMACKTISDMYRARIERINSTSFTCSPQPVNDHPYSIGKCMDVLSNLTEIGDDMYIKVAKRIMDDPNWREAFMHCPPERKKVLLRMLD